MTGPGFNSSRYGQPLNNAWSRVRDFDYDGLDDACPDNDDDNDGISDFLELGVLNALQLLLIKK